MPDNIERSKGRGKGYKFDRGGNPTEFGPFIGEVMNNVDPVRGARLQVYIEQFAGDNREDDSLWRTVSYIPPFYGSVLQSGTDDGTGTYVGNPQSYGMWFTPPDIGTLVICFFVAGDPDQGYYLGCVPDEGLNHMLPAIGASKDFNLDKAKQKEYYKDAKQLPVTEINDENQSISDNPRFFSQKKPIHSVVAGVMLQQGLITDTQRGPITSNAQRESPSSVYGISTPGRAIYQGGYTDQDIKQKLDSESIKPQDIKVIGRRGGHSLVMDDGDLEGKDNLVRIRTSKGHQITMSDDGNFFYIVHANGQTWVELGSEGTIDLFSTNSVNVRTQGEINLHADKNINMYAGESINIQSGNIRLSGVDSVDVSSKTKLSLYSQADIGVKADGAIGLNSKSGAWNGGDSLAFKGGTINLNGPGAAGAAVAKPPQLADVQLPDVAWVDGTGWKVESGKLVTICSRAPTHEPYPYHNKGVEAKASVTEFTSDTGPGGGGGGSVGAVASTPVGAVAGVATTPTALVTAQSVISPVTNPINTAQILQQVPAVKGIGALSPGVVTSLMSAAEADITRTLGIGGVVSGIGRYGISPLSLEQLGIIKPGTISKFGTNVAGLNTLLASPTIWTGKNGINSLANLVGNGDLQNRLQQDLMRSGLNKLQNLGVVNGRETIPQLGGLVNSAVQFGPGAVANWAKGQASNAIVNQIGSVFKNSQFASVLGQQVSGFLGGFGGGGGSIRPTGITGVINTFDRAPVNTAVVDVIGDEKVPVPEYKTTVIDIRAEQQQARVKAYTDARAAGRSEAEAQNISAAVGNEVGAAALAREAARAGI
jgi:hypothetical protein